MSEDDRRFEKSVGPRAVPVFFLSDSTGITAETMGHALLIQFPNLRFERRHPRSLPLDGPPRLWK